MAPPPLPSAGQLIVENLTLLSPSANYFHDQYNVTITPQTFVKHGNTVEANSALHFLLCKIQAEQADPSFKPCWPIHDREQERDFRRVVDARLAQLEKAKLLNVGVSRKSVVASAGGDRFLELLLNLSTLALQQACLQNPPYGTNSHTRMTSQASRPDSLSYQGSARSNRSLLSVVSVRSERLPSETQAPQHQHHHQHSHSHHHHHQHTHAQQQQQQLQQQQQQQQQRLGRRFLGVGILSASQQRSRDAEQVRARIDAERSALERTADLAKKGATTWASEANSLREKIVHFEAKLARLKTQLSDMGFDENGNDIRGPERPPAHANSTAMLARAMDGVTVSTDVDLRPSPSRDDLADELKTSPIDSTESGSSVDEFPEPSEVVVDIAADLSRLLTFTAETREFRDRVDRSLRGDKPSLDGANGRVNSPAADAVDIINLVRAATTELQEATNRMDEIREERRKASEDSNNEILDVPTVDKVLSNAHIPDKSAVGGQDTETSISLVSAPDETEMKEQRELVHRTQHDATSPVLEDEAVEQSNVLENFNSTEELQDQHPDPQQSFDDAGLSTDIDDEPPQSRAHKNATRPSKDESKPTSRRKMIASTGDGAKASLDDEYKESSSEDEVKECSSEDDANNASVDGEAKESSSSDEDDVKVEPEIVAENGGVDTASATAKAEVKLEVSEDGGKDGDTGVHLKELSEAANVSLQQHQSVVEACDALTKEADLLDDHAKQVAAKVDDHKLAAPKLHRSASVGMDVQMLAGSLMEVRRDETEDERPAAASATDSQVSDLASDAMKDMESAAKAIRGHGHTIEDRTRGTVAAARRKKNLMTRSLDSINLPNNPSDRTVDLCPRYDTDVTGAVHAMSQGSKSVRFAELPPSYSRSRGGSVAASGPSRQDRLTRQATEVHPKSPQSGDNNTNHSGGNTNSSKHSRMIAGEGLALREAAMSKRGVSTSGVKDYANNNVHDLAPNEPIKRAVAISGHKPPRLERKHTPHHVGRPKEVVQRIVVPPTATRAKKVNVNRTLPSRASMSDVSRTGDVSVRPRQRSESMEDIAKLSKQQPHAGASGHGHGHGNGSLSPSTSSHDLDVVAGKGAHSKHVMPSSSLPNLETGAQVSFDLATPASALASGTPSVSRQTSSVSFASPAPTGRSPVSVSTGNESRLPSTSSHACGHHPPPPPPPMPSNAVHLSSPSPSVTATMASTPLGASSSLATADSSSSPAASSVSSFSNFDSAPKATRDVTVGESKQEVDANIKNKAAGTTTTSPAERDGCKATLEHGGRIVVQVNGKDVASQNGYIGDDDEQLGKSERPSSSIPTVTDASKLASTVKEQPKNASDKATTLSTPLQQQQQEAQPPKADAPQNDATTAKAPAMPPPPPPPQPQPTPTLNNSGVSELKEEHVRAHNKLSSVGNDCSKSQDALLQTDSSSNVRRALGAGPSSVSEDCLMSTSTSTNTTQRNHGGHRPIGGKMFGKSTFMRISGVGLLGNMGSPKGRSLSMSGRDAGHDMRDVASVSNYSVDNGELSNRLNQGGQRGHSSFSSSSGGGFHSYGGIGGGGQGSSSRGGGGGGFFAGQTAQWQESMRSSQQQQQQQHQADEETVAATGPGDSHSMRSELSVSMTRASTEMGMKPHSGGDLNMSNSNTNSNSNSPSGGTTDRGAASISHHHHHHAQQQQQAHKQKTGTSTTSSSSASTSSAHSISNSNNNNKDSNNNNHHHHSNSHHGLRFGRGTGRGIGNGRANGSSTAAASGGGGGRGNNNNNGGSGGNNNGSSSSSGSNNGGSGRRKNRVQSFRARLAALTRD